MPASIIASFLSFLITGIYSFYFFNYDFGLPGFIKALLFLAILMNATYFFYFETLTEINSDLKASLRLVGKREWFIRILNQTILFSLWFLFQIEPLSFCFALILQYALYVYWDYITRTCHPDKVLFKFDMVGLVLSALFILVSLYVWNLKNGAPSTDNPQIDINLNESSINPTLVDGPSVLWAICLVFYILLPVVAVLWTGGELFKSKYWTRDAIS
tara:strand:+ start:870 stop:1517 length:648 start_codon:yes stop_codon:yes gene_type:complete